MRTGLDMEKQVLIFAIFLTCSSLVLSRKFPTVGSKDIMSRQSVGRHKTFDHVSRKKRLLSISKNLDMPGAAFSRKQHTRQVFGQASTSTDQQMSIQERKDKVANTMRGVDVISGTKRIKRSVNQPQKDLPAFLLYIVGNDIRKLTLDEYNETTLVSWKGLDGSPPSFIDFHYKENYLYWADKNSIHRSSLTDGSGIQTVHKELPSVSGLAVDWLGNNIYWMEQKRIMVSRIDGRFLKTLGTYYAINRNLALDPANGFMYWYMFTNTQDNRIMKDSMDKDTDYRESILSDLSDMTVFAIDYFDQKLFWTTEGFQIKSHKLDTDDIKERDKETFVSDMQYPVSVTVSEDYVYWINRGNYINRANKTVRRNRHVSVTKIKSIDGVNKAMGLKVVHWNIQKEYVGYDICYTRRHCSHLCLPDPDAHLFRCSCPDKMTAVGQPYWNMTCGCPSGQFVNPNGDCRYLDAPWNVIATPLNNTAIKLTWLPPKVRKSDQLMYYIYYGHYPHEVGRWPIARTFATAIVVGHLKRTIRYNFTVALSLGGRHSLAVDITPTSGVVTPSAQPQIASFVTSSVSTLSKDSLAKPPRETATNRGQRQPMQTATNGGQWQPMQTATNGGQWQPMETATNAAKHASPTNKSFPYWSIGVAGGGFILVLIVAFLLYRHKRRTQCDMTAVTLPLQRVPEQVQNCNEEDQEDETFLSQPEASV